MRNIWLRGVLSLSLLLAPGCGLAPVDESAPRCLRVSEPAGSGGLVTSAPARVSLLFSVDTCGGEPVAGLDAAQFAITEDERPVSAFESRRVIRPRAERFALSSLVLLDLSGSTLRSGAFPALKDAAARYVRAVLERPDDGQRVAVMTFDGREQPTLLTSFTADQAAVTWGLDALERPECAVSADCAGFADRRTCAGWRCVDDSTNLNGAVVQALDALDAQLAEEPGVTWKDAALVVFTDGTDQAARVAAEVALERTRASRAHVFTVGLGGEVDERALKALGKDGYFPVAQDAQLAAAFEAVARRVTGLANRFYLLDYCSPKRGGTHTLKVTASVPHGSGVTLVGGLSRDFDATGFTSGCEVQ